MLAAAYHLLASVPWHYWLGWALMIGTALTLIALLVGYLAKVQRPRYPRR